MDHEIDFAGLAAQLRGAREGRKLNLREVAEQTGVSASTLSRIERGQAQPDMRTVQAVVQWIGVPLSRILHGSVVREARGIQRVDARQQRSAKTSLDNAEIQFRADPNLSPHAAEALIKILRAAYNQFAAKK